MKNEKVKNFFSKKATRNVVVVVTVLLIGLAIYLNYRWFYDPVNSLGYGDNNMEDTVGGDANTSTGGENEQEEDYFTSTALIRQQARDEAIDVLMLITESEDADAEAKAEANEKISKIALDIQNETNIETLIKAKGFEECVAVISDNVASIIVKAESLQANEVAQIMVIVYETAGILPENVSIINK